MIGALDVLVVDDRPETVRFLTEFLLTRCRRVEAASNGKEAMIAVNRRKAAGESYQLIFCDVVMAGGDGLSLLRDLRQRNDDVPFVFMTGYRALNPALDGEAKRLGALDILDKPIELREVQRILDQGTTTLRKKTTQKNGDEPFFGTSRIMRRASEGTGAPPAHPSEALEPRPVGGAEAQPSPPPVPPTRETSEALERRMPEALRPQPAVPRQDPLRQPSALIQVGSPTARFRRSVDVVLAPAPAPAPGTSRISRLSTPQPATTFTARVRRGVEGTGAISREPRTESGRMITCTSCSRSFMAMAKSAAYTTVCVHCGQMQRIDPS